MSNRYDESEELRARQLAAQLEGEPVPESDEESSSLTAFTRSLPWEEVRPQPEFRRHLRRELLRQLPAPGPRRPWYVRAALYAGAAVGGLLILMIGLALGGTRIGGTFGGLDERGGRGGGPAAVQPDMPQSDDQYEQKHVPAYALPSGIQPSPVPASGERMVISTAQLTLIVEDVEVSLPQVQSMVQGMGGYIVDANSYRTEADRLAATITLRVPADRFQEALSQLRALAWKVESESQSGQDVTQQYVDLQAQLHAREATVKELEALLAEVRKSEGNAEEKAQAILSFYNQLSMLRSEIDQIKGQMQYFEQMSAMGTIVVNLSPREPKVEQPVVEEGFRPSRILRDAARSLVSVFQALYKILIYLVVVILPVLAAIGLPVGLVLFIWWRRRRRQRAV